MGGFELLGLRAAAAAFALDRLLLDDRFIKEENVEVFFLKEATAVNIQKFQVGEDLLLDFRNHLFDREPQGANAYYPLPTWIGLVVEIHN